MISFVASLVLGQVLICPRCHNSKVTEFTKASHIAAQRAHVKDETKAILGLIYREAGWSTPSRHSRNKRSSAYGLGQFVGKGPIGSLSGTWKSVGIRKTDCHVCQLEAVYLYCRDRKEYKSVAGAVRKWDSRAAIHRNGKPFGGWY